MADKEGASPKPGSLAARRGLDPSLMMRGISPAKNRAPLPRQRAGSQPEDPNVLDDLQEGAKVDMAAVVAAAEQQSAQQAPVKRAPPPLPPVAEGDVSSPSTKRVAPARAAPMPVQRASGATAAPPEAALRASGAAPLPAKAAASPALPRKSQPTKEEAGVAKPLPPKLMPKPRSASTADVTQSRLSGAGSQAPSSPAPSSPAPPPRKLDMSGTVAGKLGSLLMQPPMTPPKPARAALVAAGAAWPEEVGPALTHATRTRTSARPMRRPPSRTMRAAPTAQPADEAAMEVPVEVLEPEPVAAPVPEVQAPLAAPATVVAPLAAPVTVVAPSTAPATVVAPAAAPVIVVVPAPAGAEFTSPPAGFAPTLSRPRESTSPAALAIHRPDTQSRFSELLRQSRAITAAIIPEEDDAALPPLPVGEVATEYTSEEPVGESTSWSKFSAFLETVTMAEAETDESLTAKVSSPAPQSKAGLLKSMSKLGKAVSNLKHLDDDSVSNDQLYIWGQSEFTTNAQPAVQKLQHLTGENVKQIASGRNHFLLVTESGKLFSFGMGKHGVLGHGDSINTAHPKLVEALNGSSVTCAACCGHQSATITSDSKLLLWGWMGHDAFAAVLRPTVPEGLRTTLVEHVALGDDFCVIGTDGGKLLAWGGNAEGQVGCASEEDYIATPTAVVGVSGFALELAACAKSAVAVTSQGAVFYWGRNWSKENKPHRKALRLAFPKRIKLAAVGSAHVLALAFDGLVYAVGRNDVGQLGNRTLEPSLSTPVLVDLVLAHSAAGSGGGGGGGSGRALQHDPTKGPISPQPHTPHQALGEPSSGSVRKAREENAIGHRVSASLAAAPVYVKAIACGETHCVALTSQGTVMIWGKLGAAAPDMFPVPVVELGGVSISSVDCGASTVSTLVGLRSTDDLKFRSFSPPVVQAATLERLVEWLTREEDHPGEDFIYAFLLTYPTFCDAPKLIAMLRQRYETALQHGNETLERRVIKVLIKWTQKRKDDFASSEQTRKLMEEFSLALGQENYAAILQGELRKKPRIVGEGIFEAPDMTVQVFTYSTVAVAEQIALYSHTLLCRIGSRELLMGGWGARDGVSKCPGISAMIQRFNHLSSFVASTIIRHPSKDVRNKVYAFWIDCHRHLWNLNSFDGAVCLMSAFDSVPVQKLLSSQLLEQKPSAQRQLHSFSALFLENRRGYRAAIQAVLSEGMPCVPYVGILLTDVTFMRDGNPDTLDNGRLINFYKRVMLANQIKTFELMQAKPYSALQRIDGLYEYLAVARGYPTKMQDKMVAEICKGVGLPDTSGPKGLQGSHADLRADEMFAQRPVERNALRAEAGCLPADRRAVWSAWITRFQAQGNIFRALWVESGAFQETVRCVLASPVTEADQPAFELLLRTFLVPTIDHVGLAKWLYAASAAEPDSALASRIASFLERFLLLQQQKRHSSGNLTAAEAGPLLSLDTNKAPTAELARAAELEAAQVAAWVSAALSKAAVGAATTSTESDLELLSSAILQPAVPVDAMLQELLRELREAERLRDANRRQRDLEVTRLSDELEKLRAIEDEYLAKLRQVQQQIATCEVEAHEYRRTAGLQLRDAEVRVRILERGINEKRRMVDATTAAHAMFQAFCGCIPPSLQHAPSDPSGGTAIADLRDRSAALLEAIANGTQVARADLLELRQLHASLSNNPRLQEKQAASFADLKRDYQRFASAATQILTVVAEYVDAAVRDAWRAVDAELNAMQLDAGGPRVAVDERPPPPAAAAPLAPGASVATGAATAADGLRRASVALAASGDDELSTSASALAAGGAASSIAAAKTADAKTATASPSGSKPRSSRAEVVISVVCAKYKHEAEEDNELRFDVGEVIDVFKIHKSGWAKGRLQRSGAVGVFPMNFVEAVETAAVGGAAGAAAVGGGAGAAAVGGAAGAGGVVVSGGADTSVVSGVADDAAGEGYDEGEDEGGYHEGAYEEGYEEGYEEEDGWEEGEDEGAWVEEEEEEEEAAAVEPTVHLAPIKKPPPPPPPK